MDKNMEQNDFSFENESNPESGKDSYNSKNNASFEEGYDDNTADEDDIRYNPETEQPKKTKKQIKMIGRFKKARKYFIIPLIFVVIVVILLIGWQIVPKKTLNVCVLDKTILTVTEDNNLNEDTLYRKHQGLFWLLNQQKYVKEDGGDYNYKTDYFGPQLTEEGQIDYVRELTELDYVPDLMYISDVYGATDDSYGYYNNSEAKYSGLSTDDISVVSYAHEAGATVVGEMELLNSQMNASTYSQLTSMFGVTHTTWVGRYIYELQDFTDVPDWAPPMYEQQEGVEWQFSGPGILLVSSEGKIIILEQKTDFENKDLLQIYVNDEYKDEFGGCSRVNYYNWFELVEANHGTEVLATFEFNVNATGMEKMKEVSDTPRFASVVRKVSEDNVPVYYFAGDFNDYVNQQNFNKFMFADHIFRWISYDNAGDISNFFWNFYNPLMTKILSDTQKRTASNHYNQNSASHKEVSRINNNRFEVLTDGEWQELALKALSINASEPGVDKYSSDYMFYQQLIKELADMGANCVQAKSLLPPEFYRALYRNNNDPESKRVYLIQNVTLPESDNSETDDKAAWETAVKTALDAVHGNGKTSETDTLNEASYFIDVSEYVLGIIIDPKFDREFSESLAEQTEANETYTGKYYSGKSKQEAYAAQICDIAQSYSFDEYGYYIPVGFKYSTEIAANTQWTKQKSYSCDFSGLVSNSDVENYYFVAADVGLEDDIFVENKKHFGGNDYETSYVQYLGEFRNSIDAPLLVTGLSVSTNSGGNLEKQQGTILVSMLSSVDSANCLGGVVADLNDDWSAVSERMYPYTVSLENNKMWKNAADPAQNTGIISAEPTTPEESGIELADDDRLQGMSISANEGYLYITARMLDNIDYGKEALFIGLDTYQRNNGEYYYAKGYTPTSLSGMEFVIRFDDMRTAGLYVVDSYDKRRGNYSSKESYTGNYNLVSELTYGGFSTGDGQYYQTGSTIYIRIPWEWLNVTDPSQRVVMNNTGRLTGQTKTVTTDGFLLSFLIADKQSKDLMYIFPETKQDPGYKLFDWKTWETVNYVFREKDSFSIMQNYFSSR